MTRSPADFACASPVAGRHAAPRSGTSHVPPRVADALGPVLGSDASRWSVRRLADGGQARLFTARAEEGAEEVIVKVYHDDTPRARDAARDEYDCLRRLHDRLDGTTHGGWTVRCPRPLHRCDDSPALVMTRVPGETLSRHLGRGEGPPPDVLDSLARAVVSCLRRYWEGDGRLYGDLILNNVLCDLPSRTLALVDPGLPAPYYLCDAAPRAWYPASRDLGFLLFWTASLVRPSLAHPVLHARQKRMTARMLRAFLDRLASPAERGAAVDEIAACSRIHLARIRVSTSPGGTWRRFVRRVAARTIEQTLIGLRDGGGRTC